MDAVWRARGVRRDSAFPKYYFGSAMCHKGINKFKVKIFCKIAQN
jgi:hypothetical protein